MTWKTTKSTSRKINIIGCHQPVELILAKADKRIRRANKARIEKEYEDEIKRKEIEDGLSYKHLSDERCKNFLEKKRRQYAWIIIIKSLKYNELVREKYQVIANLIYHFQHSTNLMMRIKRYFINWYNRHMFRKYKIGLLKNLKNSEHILRMIIRIKRKRRALGIIRCFWMENKMKNNKFTVKIRQFFVALKIIQRCIKNVLAKTKAKIEAVAIVWMKLEYLCLSKSIEEAKQKRKQDKKLKPIEAYNAINNSNLNRVTKTIMNSQQVKWDEIDSKLEEVVIYLRNCYYQSIFNIEQIGYIKIKNKKNNKSRNDIG